MKTTPIPKPGIFSKSMGVDTKPAHKFEIDGYWILIDPKCPKKIAKKIASLIKLIK